MVRLSASQRGESATVRLSVGSVSRSASPDSASATHSSMPWLVVCVKRIRMPSGDHDRFPSRGSVGSPVTGISRKSDIRTNVRSV